MNTFSFEYEELPLVISNGIEAGFINGAAEIHYRADGSWRTGDISVEGFGERDANGKRQWPQVPAPTELAAMIVRRLEKEWEGKVQDSVNEQIAEDRQCAADDRADARRDSMIERVMFGSAR